MTPSEKARVQECVKELSGILYRNTPSDKCQSFEQIEQVVREHLLESVGSDMAFFLSNKKLKLRSEKSE
jgi:predicted transcriptional regulator